ENCRQNRNHQVRSYAPHRAPLVSDPKSPFASIFQFHFNSTQRQSHAPAVELWQRAGKDRLGALPPPVSMKHVRRKTLAEPARRRGSHFIEEDGYVNWNRMMQAFVGGAALLVAASEPLAAQGIPQSTPVTPAVVSPLSDTSAIAKEAQGWLAD